MKAIIRYIWMVLILSSTQVIAATDLNVRYRALDTNLSSKHIHAEIVVKNSNTKNLKLNEVEIAYGIQLEGYPVMEGEIVRAMIVGATDRNIAAHAGLRFAPDKISLVFGSNAGWLNKSEVLVVQFKVRKNDGSNHNQGNDPSFNASAKVLTPTSKIKASVVPKLLVSGEVVDENGIALAGAKVIAGGVEGKSGINGYFDIFVPVQDEIILVIMREGYSDFITRLKKEELLPNTELLKPVLVLEDDIPTPIIPSDNPALVAAAPAKSKVASRSRPRRRYGLTKVEKREIIDPSEATHVVEMNDKRVKIKIPQDTTVIPDDPSSSGEFTIEITSLKGSKTDDFSNYEYQGFTASLGTVELQFFHAVDIVITNEDRERLTRFSKPLEIYIQTACANAAIADMAAWHLNETTLIWEKHPNPPVFIPIDAHGYCYFRFLTDHFTKYALARGFASDYATLELNASDILSEPSALTHQYLVEVETYLGVIASVTVNASQLASLRFEDVTTNREVYVRVTNLNRGTGSGVRLQNMGDWANRTRLVKMPNTAAFKWRSTWMNGDSPGNNGDYEIRSNGPLYFCDAPFGIKVRAQASKKEYLSSAGMPNYISNFNRNYGFDCVNALQDPGNACIDYEINLLCH